MNTSLLLFGFLLAGVLLVSSVSAGYIGSHDLEEKNYEKGGVDEVYDPGTPDCQEGDSEEVTCTHTTTGSPSITFIPPSTRNPPAVTPSPSQECDKNVMNGEYGNMKKEYYSAPKHMNWLDAVEYCNNNCSALATIMSHKEKMRFYSSIGQLTSGHREQPWLGGKCENNHNCKWQNTKNKINGFNRWLDTEPDTKGGRYKCLALVGDHGDHWTLARCSEKRSFACQKFVE